MAIRIPKSLKKSPLISVSCEVRFEGIEQYSDLFATKIAYSILQGNFDGLTRLPIMQIPEQARSVEMFFEPTLGVKVGSSDILIGPKVIVARTSDYKGWDDFCKVVLKSVDNSKPYISRVIRVGFRSVDFFENRRIDDELNLSLNVNQDCKESFERDCVNFAVTYSDGNNKVRLSYSNDATVVDNGKFVKKGSVVDVDAFCNDPKEDVKDVVSKLHELGKRVFFESLKQSFVYTMEPSDD